MRDDDLVTFLSTAPTSLSWAHVRNLVALRRAHGRPLSRAAYAAILAVLEAHDAGPQDR